jgi:hypothetical protein
MHRKQRALLSSIRNTEEGCSGGRSENRQAADTKTNELSISEQLVSFPNCHGLGGIGPSSGAAVRSGLIRRAESGETCMQASGKPKVRCYGLKRFRSRAWWRYHARGANSLCDRPMRAPRSGSILICIAPARAVRRSEYPLRRCRRQRCRYTVFTVTMPCPAFALWDRSLMDRSR